MALFAGVRMASLGFGGGWRLRQRFRSVPPSERRPAPPLPSDAFEDTMEIQVLADVNILDALPVVAGLQVSISGRFWMSSEATPRCLRI